MVHECDEDEIDRECRDSPDCVENGKVQDCIMGHRKGQMKLVPY